MPNAYAPVEDDPGQTARYQELISGEPAPTPQPAPTGPSAFAQRITSPQSYMQEPTDTGTYQPQAQYRGASSDPGQTLRDFGGAVGNGLSSLLTDQRAGPARAAGMLGQVFQPFTNALSNPGAYLQASQHPNTPEELANQNAQMQNAVGMFSYTKAGSGGAADARVAGELAGGAKAAGGAAVRELEQQAQKIPAAESGFLRGESGGLKLPGGGEDAAGQRYAARQVPGTKSMYEVFDATTGQNANGVVHTTEAAAEARAAKLNATLPAADVKPADVFGDPNAPRISAAASAVPEQVQSFLRGELRSGDFTPEQFLATPNAQTLVDGLLTKHKVPVNDANRQAFAEQLIEGGLTNRIGGKGSLGVDEGAGPMGAQNVATEQPAKEAERQKYLNEIPAADLKPPPADPIPANMSPTDKVIQLASIAAGPPEASFSKAKFAEDLLSAPKSLATAAAPIHGALRHALPFAVAHPIAWAQGVGTSLQTFGQFLIDPVTAAAKFTDRSAFMRQTLNDSGMSKLYIATPHGGAATGEEQVASNLFNNIPLLGRVFQGGQTGFASLLNEVRFNAAQGVINTTKAFYGRELNGLESQSIADTINHFSGRGFSTDGDVAKAVGRILNVPFFSPQLQASRVRMFGDFANGIQALARNPGDPVALERVRLGAGYLAGIGGLLGLAKASGLNIDLNPESANFTRVNLGPADQARGIMSAIGSQLGATVTDAKDGTVWADVSAGESSYIRTIARLLTGHSINAAGVDSPLDTGGFNSKSSWDVMLDAVLGKTSPVANAITSLARDYPVDLTGLVMPMFVHDYLVNSGHQPPTVTLSDIRGYPTNGPEAGMPPIASTESDRLKAAVKTFSPMGRAALTIGNGSDQLRLTNDQYKAFATAIAGARNDLISTLLTRPDYQQASDVVKARMFEAEVRKADSIGEQSYLKDGVLTGSDPNLIRQQAVLSVHALPTERDKAQWIALMDKSGKLTSDVKAAIDASIPPAKPNDTPQPKVADYLKAAPLVTKYLSLPPYVQGNPQEWVALSAAKKHESAALEQVKQTASNLPSPALTAQARQLLPPQEQQLLAKYQNAIVNPARKQMLLKDPWLGHFLGSPTTQAQPTSP